MYSEPERDDVETEDASRWATEQELALAMAQVRWTKNLLRWSLPMTLAHQSEDVRISAEHLQMQASLIHAVATHVLETHRVVEEQTRMTRAAHHYALEVIGWLTMETRRIPPSNL